MTFVTPFFSSLNSNRSLFICNLTRLSLWFSGSMLPPRQRRCARRSFKCHKFEKIFAKWQYLMSLCCIKCGETMLRGKVKDCVLPLTAIQNLRASSSYFWVTQFVAWLFLATDVCSRDDQQMISFVCAPFHHSIRTRINAKLIWNSCCRFFLFSFYLRIVIRHHHHLNTSDCISNCSLISIFFSSLFRTTRYLRWTRDERSRAPCNVCSA